MKQFLEWKQNMPEFNVLQYKNDSFIHRKKHIKSNIFDGTLALMDEDKQKLKCSTGFVTGNIMQNLGQDALQM